MGNFDSIVPFTQHSYLYSIIILRLGSANERTCYIVTVILIGWAHTQKWPLILNDPLHHAAGLHIDGLV